MKLMMMIVLSIILGLAGGAVTAADQTMVDTAIAAADASRKKAASVGGEWRDTGKKIKKARTLAKEGKFAAAVKLANFAERQGKYGYEQAVSQQQMRIPSYLKY